MRRTWSGKIYTATAFHLRPILKDTERTSSVYVKPPPLLECLTRKRAIIVSIDHGLPEFNALPTGSKVPGHSVIRDEHDNSERKIKLKFAENLSVQFCVPSGKKEIFFDRAQPLIDRHDFAKTHNITIYIMTCSIGIENSIRELLYPAYWSKPISNDILINNEDV